MGEISKSLRFRVLKRDGFKCAYCGGSTGDGVVLHVDHRIPKCDGGSSELENLVTACADCNHGKGPHPGRTGKVPGRGKPDKSSGVTGRFFHSRVDGRIRRQGYVVAELPGERYLVRMLSWLDGLPVEERIVRGEEMRRWSFYPTARDMRWAWARENHTPTDNYLLMERAINTEIRERGDAGAGQAPGFARRQG